MRITFCPDNQKLSLNTKCIKKTVACKSFDMKHWQLVARGVLNSYPGILQASIISPKKNSFTILISYHISCLKTVLVFWRSGQRSYCRQFTVYCCQFTVYSRHHQLSSVMYVIQRFYLAKCNLLQGVWKRLFWRQDNL